MQAASTLTYGVGGEIPAHLNFFNSAAVIKLNVEESMTTFRCFTINSIQLILFAQCKKAMNSVIKLVHFELS